MVILENVKLDELAKIFDENNQNYVSDKNCIFDEKFLKIVAVENNEAIGYITIYLGSDFIQQEEYPIKYDVKENSIYIWNGITKKGHEGKGVQTQLLTYLKSKYKLYDIYSVVDIKNIASKKMHNKNGFKPILNFNKEYDGIVENFTLCKINATIKEPQFAELKEMQTKEKYK